MIYNKINIRCLRHASFRIKYENHVIYIDPYNIKETEPAELILITHGHYDHCSPAEIKKLSGMETLIIAPEDAKRKLEGLGYI